MSQSQYEKEEYLEPNDDELEVAARNKKLIVLGVMAALVILGIFLVDKLRTASLLQDCLMTRAPDCREINPPQPIADAPSTTR